MKLGELIMSERKLATVRRILEINPIEGADSIEVVTVDGWKVVSQKGLYQPGDLVIYLEVDSWVPTEIASFLSKGKEPREYNGVKGERLRTIKLRGQISQGLLLPLTCIKNYSLDVLHGPYPVLDLLDDLIAVLGKTQGEEEITKLDFTDLLGILKYEAPIPACLAGEVIGMFPSFIPRTDEERCQNLTNEWDNLKKLSYIVTEKLDGTSCTIYKNNDYFGVCSRNLDLKEIEGNTLWSIARRYSLEEKFKNIGRNIAIQGEVIGEGIQKNPYKIKGQDIYIFNGYDIDKQKYLSVNELDDICQIFELKQVPFIDMLNSIELITIENILSLADGKSILNSNINREGIIFKTLKREKSFKAISNIFLVKEKD